MVYNRSFFQFLKFHVLFFCFFSLTLASKQFYRFINLIKEPIFGFIDFSQFFSFPILLSFACPNSFFLLTLGLICSYFVSFLRQELRMLILKLLFQFQHLKKLASL